jgi:hypothetical protein
MRKPSFRSLVLFPILGSVILATGCSASGGGTIAPDASSTPCSANGPAAAKRPDITFGFQSATTLDLLTTFNGTFTDSCTGIRLTGSGKLNPVPAPREAPAGVGGCMGGIAFASSGNPNKTANVDTFVLTACDLGKQATGTLPTGDTITGDYLMIQVIDGPHAGYFASGTVDKGNIVVLQ